MRYTLRTCLPDAGTRAGPVRVPVSPAPLVEDGSASLGGGGLRLAACAVVLSTAVAQCGVPGLGWTARHEVRGGCRWASPFVARYGEVIGPRGQLTGSSPCPGDRPSRAAVAALR